jgi:hypothetical protein
VVDGAFVLKDDLSDFVQQNKHAIINSYRSKRDELLSETDWTQTEDCPLHIHKREEYKAYRKYLRDFPEKHDPEIDENGEAVNFSICPKRLLISCFSCRDQIQKNTTPRCLDPRPRV